MRVKYLGTGGGAGIPEMFCSCRVCESARENGGREQRSRPLAVVDGEMCIDLPCDARSSFLRQGVDARALRYILITHSHYDHFLPENLFSRPEGAHRLELYISHGSGDAFRRRCEALSARKESDGLRPICIPDVRLITPFEPTRVGRYSVTALPANHDASVESLNYIISDGGKSLLWLHDTGVLLRETERYLEDARPHFNFVSMDCALPDGSRARSEHMDLSQCKQTADYLRNIGTINKETRLYLSHIGHLVGCTHDELSVRAAATGFETAFDGAEIEF